METGRPRRRMGTPQRHQERRAAASPDHRAGGRGTSRVAPHPASLARAHRTRLRAQSQGAIVGQLATNRRSYVTEVDFLSRRFLYPEIHIGEFVFPRQHDTKVDWGEVDRAQVNGGGWLERYRCERTMLAERPAILDQPQRPNGQDQAFEIHRRGRIAAARGASEGASGGRLEIRAKGQRVRLQRVRLQRVRQTSQHENPGCRCGWRARS